MPTVAKTGILIVWMFLAISSHSQNQLKADSIKYTLENEELTISEQLEAYYWLAGFSGSPDDELKYAEIVLDLARKSNNREYIIKANQRIGVAHRLMGNLGKALAYLFESANDAAGKEEYKSILIDTYTEISSCYTQNGDSKNALRYGQKAIRILRKTDRKQELALNLLNAGYDHYLIQNYDSAMAYYNESEPILEDVGLTIGIAYIIGNRALVIWKQGDPEKAMEDLFKAIEMLEPFGDKYAMADYYNQIGNIFLEKDDHQKAVKYLTLGLEMAREEGMKEQVRDASYSLSVLYKKTGEYVKAIDFEAQYHAYKDSIQNLETTQKIANLRTSFEVGRKQAEVDLLVAQKRTNQIIMITGGVILLIVLFFGAVMYSNSKSKVRLNKQLNEQKDSLLALNNTKDKFFSIISHDLRGPVNNLSGLISVSKYYLDEDRGDQLKEMIGKMEHSVESLIVLLDNLLHWALHQRGHFPYVPEKFNLKNLLMEVADMFTDMATSKNIELDLQCEDDFDAFIDKHTTSTIFRNLLNNAIKFTDNDGKIQVVLEKDETTDSAVVKIIDNGVGISNNRLKTLFDSNENSSTKGTSGEAGLGLGLRLVYDFVQLNKGKIDVASDEGKGTTFTVRLPLATA